MYLEFWKTAAGTVMVLLMALAIGERASKRMNMAIGAFLSVLAGHTLGHIMSWLARAL